MLALLCGFRCSRTLSDCPVFLAASSSSLLATWFGASRIRRGSSTSEVCLVNVCRLTQCCYVVPSSLLSCACQFSYVELHSRWPAGVKELLTYTHNVLSAAVTGVMCGGVQA